MRCCIGRAGGLNGRSMGMYLESCEVSPGSFGSGQRSWRHRMRWICGLVWAC